MNLPNLIHRLRRVASGESLGDVYGDEYDPDKTRCHMVDCRSWANACFDQTPITEEVLAELGYTLYSGMDDGHDWDRFRVNDDGRTEVWQYSETEWIVEMYDQHGHGDDGVVTTRGQLIQLLSALGVWDGE